jgi:hypothetical protein
MPKPWPKPTPHPIPASKFLMPTRLIWHTRMLQREDVCNKGVTPLGNRCGLRAHFCNRGLHSDAPSHLKKEAQLLGTLPNEWKADTAPYVPSLAAAALLQCAASSRSLRPSPVPRRGYLHNPTSPLVQKLHNENLDPINPESHQTGVGYPALDAQGSHTHWNWHTDADSQPAAEAESRHDLTHPQHERVLELEGTPRGLHLCWFSLPATNQSIIQSPSSGILLPV